MLTRTIIVVAATVAMSTLIFLALGVAPPKMVLLLPAGAFRLRRERMRSKRAHGVDMTRRRPHRCPLRGRHAGHAGKQKRLARTLGTPPPFVRVQGSLLGFKVDDGYFNQSPRDRIVDRFFPTSEGRYRSI
jgi:hypothetical protein